MKVLAELRATVWLTALVVGLAGPALAQSDTETNADASASEDAPATEAAETPAEPAAAEAAAAEDSTAVEDDSAAADYAGGIEGSGDMDDRVGGTEEPKFIKGHLVHPGTREYLSRFDHFGVRMGPAIIDNDIYATVDPGIAMYTKGFAFALHVPLRLCGQSRFTCELEREQGAAGY